MGPKGESAVVPSGWVQSSMEQFDRRLKHYLKKHKRETFAVLDNLDSLHKTLEMGTHPQQIRTGWLHPEPKGVKAITEQGRGKSLKATRLYVYIALHNRTIYLLTLGDKKSQNDDIRDCENMVDGIRKQPKSN